MDVKYEQNGLLFKMDYNWINILEYYLKMPFVQPRSNKT